MSEKHEWFEMRFNYGGWIECSCGFSPASQEEFDQHERVMHDG